METPQRASQDTEQDDSARPFPCESELLQLPFSAFIDPKLKLENPLLDFDGLPHFENVRTEHVVPAVTEIVKLSGRVFTALERSLSAAMAAHATSGVSVMPGWEAFGRVLDELGLAAQRVIGPVEHLVAVSFSEELNRVKEEAETQLVDFQLKMGQSEVVFRALQQVLDDWKRGLAVLSQAQVRALEWRLSDARSSGVGLAECDRKKFNELQKRLKVLTSQFDANVLASIKSFSFETADESVVAGVPRTILEMALVPGASDPEKGPWKFGFDEPTRMAILEYGRNRDLRRWVVETRARIATEEPHSNQAIIHEIVQLKAECARMLGFSNYAHQSLSTKAASSPTEVTAFSERLLSRSRQKCIEELDELRALSSEYGIDPSDLALHDVAFLFERQREQKYQFSSEDMRPYFPFPRVLDGLRQLCERYFGFTFQEGQVSERFPTWHDDVVLLHVSDLSSGEKLASIYVDPYARSGLKQSGAWASEFWPRHRSRLERQDVVVLPVGMFVCNGTPPSSVAPSLMSVYDVQTMLHEFGHLMQFMLARVDVSSVAGFSGVEWDVVEVASQFMENWLYEKEGMDLLSGHYQTGEQLPAELFEKFVRARGHGRGWSICRQLSYGMFDMALYSKESVSNADEILELAGQIKASSIPLPLPQRDLSPCSFSHIFSGSYAAGYYGYLWSEVWSADAFAALLEARSQGGDAAMQKAGRAYRESFLGVGGGLHPQVAFEQFRGRAPLPDALFRQMEV